MRNPELESGEGIAPAWKKAPRRPTALRSLIRSLRDVIFHLHLANPALWLVGKASRADPRLFVSNFHYRRRGAPDGLPIPPPDLIFLVAGTTDISWFLHIGALGAATVTDALARQGIEFQNLDAVLDFGCGCGRVARYWNSLQRVKVYGTDYNPRLVEWCRGNLPFAEFELNRLSPPLAHPDSQFDVVYAFSVFTHLTEELQLSWIKEMHRILKPGGHLLLSTHGESYVHRLNPLEHARFESGELVVKNDVKSPGSNTCAAYHPLNYVRRSFTRHLDIVQFVPEGARGNPPQDLYVLRRPNG